MVILALENIQFTFLIQFLQVLQTKILAKMVSYTAEIWRSLMNFDSWRNSSRLPKKSYDICVLNSAYHNLNEAVCLTLCYRTEFYSNNFPCRLDKRRNKFCCRCLLFHAPSRLVMNTECKTFFSHQSGSNSINPKIYYDLDRLHINTEAGVRVTIN